MRLGRKSRLPGAGDTPEEPGEEHIPATIPVLVYGRLENEPFQEQTEPTDVSPHGALVPIATALTSTQMLILTNFKTSEELACRVIRLVRTEDGKTLAELEFLQPSPQFWCMNRVE